MAKRPEKQAKSGFPGVPFEQFKAVVEKLAELRDSGEVLIFLGKSSSARIIGAGTNLEQRVAEKLSADGFTIDCSKALKEVASLLRLVAAFGDASRAARTLEQMEYAGEINALDAKDKDAFKAELTSRCEYIFNTLFVDSLQRRAKRFRTVTAPSLEEVDFELVRERLVEDKNDCFREPFVRLKLRYAEQGPAFLHPFFFFSGNER